MIKMKLVEILKPDFICEDARGALVQITHENYAQTNAVFTHKGQNRGNYHYHRFTKEVFYIISGKIKVDLEYGDNHEEHIFSSGDMFMIYENIRHCFNYIEDTFLVVFYTERIELENGEKDIVTL